MFTLQQIALTQFKNYRHQAFQFRKKVVGIYGPNGMGKTNLLDAIYYLCFTKSYFTPDNQLALQGSAGFRVEGNFLHAGEKSQVLAILRETGKKEFSLNNENYTRLGKHIGKYPAVIIAPDDVAIITGGSEERRKLFDALLCQLNPEYLQQLMDYNKLIQQRNSFLKQMAENGTRSPELLLVFDEQLATAGAYIYDQRKVFLAIFLEKATEHYHTIAQSNEAVALSYQSQLHHTGLLSSRDYFLQLLKQQYEKDLAIQRSTTGIHRDDLKLELSGQPFKQIASQGQRKSLLFALKLTEFEMLQEHKGFAPLLLLDDVFEKLDNERMTNLLTEVCIEKSGQVFITDTHKERLENQLAAIGCDYEIMTVEI
jgi:DNA replication and repair protein RecF